LIGQLTSKGLNKENINIGSQEDADTPELKFGDDKLREFGQSHTGDHVYNFMHNLNINLEILF
jgi:hypothetical protein